MPCDAVWCREIYLRPAITHQVIWQYNVKGNWLLIWESWSACLGEFAGRNRWFNILLEFVSENGFFPQNRSIHKIFIVLNRILMVKISEWILHMFWKLYLNFRIRNSTQVRLSCLKTVVSKFIEVFLLLKYLKQFFETTKNQRYVWRKFLSTKPFWAEI